MRRADRQVRGSVEARAREADKRAREVVRRIEKGDVQPRPLPNLRKDSMRSIASAETVSGVTGEASAQGMQDGMPLEGIMPTTLLARGRTWPRGLPKTPALAETRTRTTSAKRTRSRRR